jgi:isochorismate synthase EntC
VYAADGLVGASPELLVARHGSTVISRPLAGTTTVLDDGALERLSDSVKDGHEHRLVVRAIVDALAPWCDRLEVADAPEVDTFADVAHLATPVHGRLRAPAADAVSLVRALHPTPAVAGTPTVAALEAIARLEPDGRGRYAGPVGWVNGRGDGEWAVALRGAALDGRRAVLHAGAGIVAGSDPDAEWAETEAKLEPMLRALVRP